MLSIKSIIMVSFLCISLPFYSGCAGMLDSRMAAAGGFVKFAKGNFREALAECEENYNFSYKHGFNTAKAYTAACVAIIKFNLNDYEDSKSWALQAENIAYGIENVSDRNSVIVLSLKILSAVQVVQGDYFGAVENAQKALSITSNEESKKETYLVIGQAHALSGDYQKAFESLRKAEGLKIPAAMNPLFQEVIDKNFRLAFSAAEANKLFAERDYDSSIRRFDEVINNHFKGPGFHPEVFNSLKKIGDIYNENNMFELATFSYKKAIDYGKKYAKSSLIANLEQHMQQQEQFSKELPCDLVLLPPRFNDRDSIMPNNVIDAGESAEFLFVVKNNGKGTGFATILQIRSENPKIKIEKQIAIGDIYGGEIKEVKVKLDAGFDLHDGKAPFHINLAEKRGYDAKKVLFQVTTAMLTRPQLEIVSTEISDGETGLARGNGNGILENGETVELTVLVKNNGEGKAIGVDLRADNRYSGVQWLRDSFHMSTIQPGEIGKAKLAFSIPRGFAASEINTSLKVSDARGVNEADKKIVLSYARRTPSIHSLVRVASRGSELDTLSNGQTYELDLTFSNNGEISAKDVTASISADRSISLSETKLHLGEIKAGESVSKRIALTLPRTFAESQAQLRVDVSQADFPSTSEAIQYAVDVKRPKLTYQPSLQGRSGGNTLEQGESSVFEVQVLNEGNLPASGVQVTVKSGDDNLKIGQFDPLVGLIPANSGSETIKIPVSTLRRIKAGLAMLDVKITQDDFAPVAEDYAINVVEEGAVVVDVESEGKERLRTVAKALSGPSISLMGSQNELVTGDEFYKLAFTAEDSRNIEKVIVTVNGRVMPSEGHGPNPKKIDRLMNVPLKEGENRILIIASNVDHISSKPKELVITRLAEEDVDVPPITGIKEPDAVAVVIGISRYENKDVPRVDYARRDAATVKEYLVRTLGFDEKRVIELYDDGATLSKLNSFFRTKLKNLVVPGKSDVFVFYSGHGVPDVNKKEPYLAPYGLDPADVENTGYVLKDLYEQLARIDAKSVTVAIDSCFSGSSEGGAIIKDISPVFLDVSNPMLKVKNGVIFTASSSTQVSSWYHKKQHGLFTYFFLNGLRGKADKDNDGQVTVQELGEYVKRNVTEQARQLNREQTPEVTGGKDKVLLKYK